MPPQCQMDAPAIREGGARSPPPAAASSPSHRRKRAGEESGGGNGRPAPESSRLLRKASMELEVLRCSAPATATAATSCGEATGGTTHSLAAASSAAENLGPFPPACRRLLFGIEGNSRCVDCGEANPEWASVSYGALLCLGCSGHHRNLGVKTSFVRSISMDHWSHAQVLGMLEGGNRQLSQFFARHRLPAGAGAGGPGAANVAGGAHRYRTVAARFYREKLAEHVADVGGRGEYRGREHARRRGSAPTSTPTKTSSPERGGSAKEVGRPRSSPPSGGAAAAEPRVGSASPDAVEQATAQKQYMCRSMTA